MHLIIAAIIAILIFMISWKFAPYFISPRDRYRNSQYRLFGKIFNVAFSLAAFTFLIVGSLLKSQFPENQTSVKQDLPNDSVPKVQNVNVNTNKTKKPRSNKQDITGKQKENKINGDSLEEK